MCFNHNPLTDEVGFENYMALYLAIKGYVPKGSNKRVYPTAKSALRLLGILTTDDRQGDDIRCIEDSEY